MKNTTSTSGRRLYAVRTDASVRNSLLMFFVSRMGFALTLLLLWMNGFTSYAQGNLSVQSNFDPIICTGGSTTLTLSASGGTPPYQYSLNGANFQSSGVFLQVTSGTYTSLIAKDANGNTYTLPSLSIADGTLPLQQAWPDADADGYGSINGAVMFCQQLPVGYIATGGDCNDADNQVHPGATELCNQIDDDCDGTVDNTTSQQTYFTDADGDGYGTGNGQALCYDPGFGYSLIAGDCNDANDMIYPFSAEVCNGLDDDCNTLADDGLSFETYYTDADQDQYGTSQSLTVCYDPGLGYAANSGDCDDANAQVNPSASETCNGVDDNCNGLMDSADPLLAPAGVLTLSASAGTISCHGGQTNVVLQASGGVAPYTYGGAAVTGIGAGTYSYSVTDANGCQAFTTQVITQPSLLTANSTAGDIACFGGTTGVTVSATGGTSPYAGTGAFTIAAGTYAYTVTDAQGCTAQTTITRAQPALLQALSSSGTIACFGGTTLVNVSGTGGVLPYTGNGNKTVSAGPYSFVLTDAKGCTATTTGTVNQPALLMVSALAGPINCAGGSTLVTVSASGGTLPYTSVGTSTVVAGTYSYTVTDARGCSASTSIVISEPLAISATLQVTNTSCPTCTDGALSVASVSGGVPPYSYADKINLSAGYHCITITDASGCTFNACDLVNAASCSISASASTGNISCFGGTTTVVVSASGGTAPVSGTGSFTASAGTSTYVVTDANGCPASVTVNLAQPALLTASAGASPVLCYGGTTAALVSAAGGTAPYTGTGVFTVTAGAYAYTVTDANGCTAQASLTIQQPTALQFTATPGIINCHGGTTSVVLSASGGTLPYNGTGTVPFVGTGNYTYAVTDGNGCSASASVQIPQPALLTVAASGTNVTCFGVGNGSIAAAVNGGTLPYSYSWNNGSTAATQSGLTPGNYSVLVTDARGCTATSSSTISQPSSLQAGLSNQQNVSCFGGNDGSVIVVASGGTSPYAGTGIQSNLVAGNFAYTVTDANGCAASVTAIITQPTTLTASASPGTINCFGGNTSVLVTASGGVQPYAGVGTFTAVSTGTYSYTVSDANGCGTTVQAVIPQPAVLAASATGTNITCHAASNGSAAVAVQGGTQPYAYAWSNAGTTSAITGLQPGNYSVLVTDARGCTSTSSVALSQPTPLQVSLSNQQNVICHGGNTGAVTVVASGGTQPYAGNGLKQQLTAGPYLYTVTDANGCTASIAATITQPTAVIISAVQNTPILCHGQLTTLTVSGSGGTGSLTGTGTFTVPAGNYTYTLTDASQCTASTTVQVQQPDLLQLSTAVTNVTCYGGSNGIIDLTPTGGTGNLTYAWSGAALTSGSTLQDLTGLTAASYSVVVTDANMCSAAVSATVTQPLPFPQLGAINGTFSGCLPLSAGSTQFSVAPISDGVNQTFYQWTVPNGMTITSGQGTPQVTVEWTYSAIDAVISGTLSVDATNICGSRTSTASIEYAAVPPVTPGSISGATRICPGDTVTWSVSIGARAKSYVWSLPVGVQPIGIATTNILKAVVTGAYNGGTLSVAAVNLCGSSPQRSRSIMTNIPGVPNVISGNFNGVCNANALVYSVVPLTGIPNYQWSFPAGVQILSGQNTSSVTVNWGTTAGTISVISVNNCGSSAARSATVTTLPGRPVSISGPSPACVGVDNPYSTPTVAGASSYVWSGTSNPVINGQGAKSITMNWAAGVAANQTVLVRASNACGLSLSRNRSVTVTTCVRLDGSENPLVVYPNPTAGRFALKSAQPISGEVTIRLMDVGGKCVATYQFDAFDNAQTMEFSIGHLKEGVYMLEVQGENRTFRERIVKINE